ncbi:MAG: flagellar protein FlgN [Salinisphaera sp.]|jgi:flagellar biosynthesis/type III secretory pathway chaperone|nr:flagellar protein FlgN [Salinisphaera sp.]
MTQDYRAHLEIQIAAIERFIELMQRERALLVSEGLAIGALMDVTELKQSMAARLEALEAERRALTLGIASHAGINPGEDAAIAAHAGADVLWTRLRGCAISAREHNDHNGEAINTRLSHTDRALAELRRANPAALYAADGQRRSASKGRIHSGA